jgi:hypothetical protein
MTSLSDDKTLNCNEFYILHGNDFHRIVAMMIGVTKEEYGIELCFQEEPFLSFVNEIQPKKNILREELLRRAILQKPTILPRPAQWERDKILSALRNEYSPKLSTDDVKFLTVQVNALHELYAYKKKELLSSLSDGGSNEPKNRGWTSEITHLRFYHAVVMESQRTIQTRTKRTAMTELWNDVWDRMQFWRQVENRMNDKLWIPESLSIPNSRFEERQELPFVFRKPVSLAILKSKFEKLRQKIKRAMCSKQDVDGNWKRTVDGTSPKTLVARVSYFLTLLQEYGIAMKESSHEFQSLQVSVISSPPKDEEEAKKKDQLKSDIAGPVHEIIQFCNRQLLPIASQSDIVLNDDITTKVPNAARMEEDIVDRTADSLELISVSDSDITDCKLYLASAALYSKQLEILHSLEHDLISMESRRVALSKVVEPESNRRMKMLLESFCRHKEESIILLKRQMSYVNDVTESYSKRLRVGNS